MRRGRGTDRLLATVMFTDVVGSTELAGKLGDRAWKKVLERHNAIVRRELKRFAGRELDTAGDGFFVMFDRPAQAIDCAWAVIDALRPLDLQIRAAIHMGEVEVMGGKVGGIAVHAASRVLSMAQPGQIYVTSIVHDVVAGSDITFADKGVHELRGVPGEWRVYAVEQTSTDRAVPIEPMAEPTGRRRNMRLLVAAVGVIALIGVAGGAIALANLPRPAPIVPQPNTVVGVRSADGAPFALVEIEDPTETAIDAGALWVLSGSGRTVNRMTLPGGSVSAVGLPAVPTGMAIGDGAVWITTGFGALSGEAGVLRVGMSSRQVEDTIPLGSGADGVAVGEGAVWVTNRIDNTLTRIDLTTRVVTGTSDVGEEPGAVVVGDGSVWVANAVDQTVWRIDPGTMARTAEISLADRPFDITLAFGRLWVTSEVGASVTLVDAASNTIQRTLAMPGPARGITASSSEVWVAVGSGEVVRIDPEDPQGFSTIMLNGAPYDVAADTSSGWVSLRE